MTESYLFNLVDDAETQYTQLLHQRLDSAPGSLAPLTKAFYERHGDDYDFLVFVTVRSPSNKGTASFNPVRRPHCPELGHIGKIDDGAYWGSPKRLRGVIVSGLLMESGWSPPTTNHEFLHSWGVHFKGDFGFSGGHWNHASTHGSLGGFDLRTLRSADGTPIADPLSVQPGTQIRVASYGAGASSISKAYSPIELYMMGLVDASEVEPSFYVMKRPEFLSSANNELTIRVDGFTRFTLADLATANGGSPPRATQTTFRAAWVLVSETPAAPEVLAKAEKYAMLCGGVQEDVPPSIDEQIAELTRTNPPAPGMAYSRAFFSVRDKYLSFAEATGRRAQMDVRVVPLPVPTEVVAAPMAPAPTEVVAAPMAPAPMAPAAPVPVAPVADGVTVHASQRFCSMKVTQAEYDGFGVQDSKSEERASELTRRLYAKFRDDFDFIVFVRDVVAGGEGRVTRIGVSNAVQGIGAPVYDRTALFGSSGRLKAHLTHASRRSLQGSFFLRNLCSQWANYAIHTEDAGVTPNVGTPIGRGTRSAAWGFSGCGGQLGGFEQSTLLVDVDGKPGKYHACMPGRATFGCGENGVANFPYSNLELYLMGMIPDSELTPFDVFTGVSIDPADVPSPGSWNGNFNAAVRTTYDRARLLELLGPRTPAAAGPVELRLLVCVLTTADALDPKAAADIDASLRRFSLPGNDAHKAYYNFWEATGGRGSLSLDLSGSLR